MDPTKDYAVIRDNLTDPWWRLNHLYLITDKTGQRRTFKPNWAQCRFLNDMHSLNVLLKARQLGFSTLILIWLLDKCLWIPDTRAGVIAHTKEDAMALFSDKIRFPYDHLPELVRQMVPLKKATESELLFANNSRIRVATSMRSGTLQYLHVSEYGKLSRQFPKRAKEVKTGSLQALAIGQTCIVESTAEGRDGNFYQLCEDAQNIAQSGRKLGDLDFRFHFFPWYLDPGYRVSDEEAQETTVSREITEYFDDLAAQTGYDFDPAQIVWYAKKKQTLGELMYQEYPSTPEEAFRASVEGAYYRAEMALLRREKRIRPVAWVREERVNTAWDLGRRDATAIIFHQHIAGEHRIVDYLEDNEQDITYYARELGKKEYIYGTHYLPHDAEHKTVLSNDSAADILGKLLSGRIDVVPRIESQQMGIDAVRLFLKSGIYMDEANTVRLVECLDHYRKEWDERLGAWKNQPLHDWSSHAAKATEQLALGWRPGRKPSSRKRRSANWRTA